MEDELAKRVSEADYWPVEIAAQKLMLCPKSVRDYCRAYAKGHPDGLPCIRIGKHWRVIAAELPRWRERRHG